MHQPVARLDLQLKSLTGCNTREFRAQLFEYGRHREIGRRRLDCSGFELTHVEQVGEQSRYDADCLPLLRQDFDGAWIGGKPAQRGIETDTGLQRLARE